MLAFGYIVRTKCPFLVTPKGLNTSKQMHSIYLPQTLQKPAATALNSTLTMLMVEYGGRANLSGIIMMELYELGRLMVPNPFHIAPVPDIILTASDHALVTRDRRTESGFRLTLTDTRRAIDAPVFEYLGLTSGEQDDLYNATYDAIVKRQIAEANVS